MGSGNDVANFVQYNGWYWMDSSGKLPEAAGTVSVVYRGSPMNGNSVDEEPLFNGDADFASVDFGGDDTGESGDDPDPDPEPGPEPEPGVRALVAAGSSDDDTPGMSGSVDLAGPVHRLYCTGHGVVAAGQFDSGAPLAVWYPSSSQFMAAMSEMSTGPLLIHTITAVDKLTLYIGGKFEAVEGSTSVVMASWSALDWQFSAVGSGMRAGACGTGAEPGEVFAIATWNDSPIIGGRGQLCDEAASPSPGVSTVGLYESDVQSITTVQLLGHVAALAVHSEDGSLYLAGWLQSCDGTHCAMGTVLRIAAMGHAPEGLVPLDTAAATQAVLPCGRFTAVTQFNAVAAVGGQFDMLAPAACAARNYSAPPKLMPADSAAGNSSCALGWLTAATDVLAGTEPVQWACHPNVDGVVYTLLATTSAGPRAYGLALQVVGGMFAGIVLVLLLASCAEICRSKRRADSTLRSLLLPGGATGVVDQGAVTKHADTQRTKALAARATGAAAGASAASTRTTPAAPAIPEPARGMLGAHDELEFANKLWLALLVPLALAGLSLMAAPAELRGNRMIVRSYWDGTALMDYWSSAVLSLPVLLFIIAFIALHVPRLPVNPSNEAVRAWGTAAWRSGWRKAVKRPTYAAASPQDTADKKAAALRQAAVPALSILFTCMLWTLGYIALALASPAPLTLQALSPGWGSLLYTVVAQVLGAVSSFVLSKGYEPYVPKRRAMRAQLLLRVVHTLALSATIALNPGVKLTALLAPALSSFTYLGKAGLLLYFAMAASNSASGGPASADNAATSAVYKKLQSLAGWDPVSPSHSWQQLLEARLQFALGTVIDVILLSGLTVVTAAQLAMAMGCDFLLWRWIGQHYGKRALAHNALFARHVRALHVTALCTATWCAGLASPSITVALTGAGWLSPAVAAACTLLIGLRLAVPMFLTRVASPAMQNIMAGFALLLFIVVAAVDVLALLLAFAYALAAAAALPLIIWTAASHTVLCTACFRCCNRSAFPRQNARRTVWQVVADMPGVAQQYTASSNGAIINLVRD